MSSSGHRYHPIYRTCLNCGTDQFAPRATCDIRPVSEPAPAVSERVRALREARELIKKHAVMTWNSGLIERSDGITDTLADFDFHFPEALQ